MDEKNPQHEEKALELLRIGDLKAIKEFKARTPEINTEKWKELINKTGNVEKFLTKEWVELFEFPPCYVGMLIIESGNIPKYLTKEHCKNLGLDSFIISLLIKETKQIPQYINPQFCKGLLDPPEIIELINASGNAKEFLIPENCNGLGLRSSDICELLVSNPEVSVTPDLCKQFELTSSEIIHLLYYRGIDNLTIEESAEYGLDAIGAYQMLPESSKLDIKKYPLIKKYMKHSKNNQINLPEGMTIGVEIESVGRNSRAILREPWIFGWSCRPDTTVFEKNPNNIFPEDGVEVVSPILREKNKQSSNQIAFMTAFLKSSGQYINKTCGGHVHIGADYLTSVESYQNLIEIWANTEKILYIISNKEGELPRPNIMEHAPPISGNLKEGSVNLMSTQNLNDLKRKLMESQDNDKFRAVNFSNLNKTDKRTIEFRISNGTLDHQTWFENINLYGGLMTISEQLSKIQSKEPSQLSEDEKTKINLFNDLKKPISEEEKMETLIALVIPNEENRNVYRKRYLSNSKLLEENESLNSEINERISKEPTELRKSGIGKAIFTGDEQVTGPEYQHWVEGIKHQLEQTNDKKGVAK
ncbi:MAG: amidoligase family protein [Clostridia bacterium]|nr:amidoligase family protein [Clostridia bacterium]